jgi:hypothetical protein
VELLSNLLKSKKSTLHIISDGGLYDDRGTFGVVILDGTKVLAENKGQIYSVDFHQSLFRSEMHAMLAAS